jgi:SAM-dependent methyltransferase
MRLNPPHLILALVVLLSAAPARAGQKQDAFEPQYGQPGKDVVWVPTPQSLVEKMLDLAKVTKADYVIDLGAGDGVTVIGAAKRGIRAHGIEYDERMVELARKKAREAGVEGLATFAKADIFQTDFSHATVVTMFLLPSLNIKLRPTLLDMKPGTRIVTNTFDMEDWQPDEEASTDPCERWCRALLWVVPAKVAGTWRMSEGDLTLTQKFQFVAGALGTTAVANGRLRGDDIRFDVGGTQYTGRVNGSRIEGTFAAGTRSGTWTAIRQ